MQTFWKSINGHLWYCSESHLFKLLFYDFRYRIWFLLVFWDVIFLFALDSQAFYITLTQKRQGCDWKQQWKPTFISLGGNSLWTKWVYLCFPTTGVSLSFLCSPTVTFLPLFPLRFFRGSLFLTFSLLLSHTKSPTHKCTPECAPKRWVVA